MGSTVVIHGTTPTSTRTFGEAESLKAVRSSITAEHGVEVISETGDLTSECEVNRMVEEIRSHVGQIDILVNCAGGDIGALGTTGRNGGKPETNDGVFVSSADIRVILDRNLLSCIWVCREVAPEMMKRKAGRIVNFSSTAAMHGHADEVIYATSKAAVIEYSRCLAVQMRPYDVTVNVVAPGLTITPRITATRHIDEHLLVESGTLQRCGRPIEIANMVAFLVSPKASFVSATVIPVDGGEHPWAS